MRIFTTPADLASAAGSELGVSEWRTIEQSRIDQFADATDDHQWIHVDAERAAAGPFGATVAHGYLTLSLLPALLREIYRIEHVAMSVNYGIDRLRFPSPVTSGSRVRARASLESANSTDEAVLAKVRTVVEIDGAEKPAIVADLVVYLVPAAD